MTRSGILDAVESQMKYCCVFERLGGALTNIRQHRVAGITDEDDFTMRPSGKSFVLAESPFHDIVVGDLLDEFS